jgi:hypothetical protein
MGLIETVVALQTAGRVAGEVSRFGAQAFLYIGPDQLLPLTSFLGAIAGILLMFWNRFVNGLRWARKLLTGRKSER